MISRQNLSKSNYKYIYAVAFWIAYGAVLLVIVTNLLDGFNTVFEFIKNDILPTYWKLQK
jgi:hypothetical protein